MGRQGTLAAVEEWVAHSSPASLEGQSAVKLSETWATAEPPSHHSTAKTGVSPHVATGERRG